MTRFEFATATRIIFGPGTARELPALACELGSRADGKPRVLVVRGSTGDRLACIREELTAKTAVTEFSVPGEPTTELVEQGVRLARENQAEVVIGLGGGSVIDAAKAIAGLVANTGDMLEYLEVIGQGKPLQNPGLPFIALPTTAGPGTEVTRNAVLASTAHRVKVSLRSPMLLPKVALVDPEFTYALPPAITAATGLDALTQVIEPFLSVKANPLTDALCRDGMHLASESLLKAFRDGSDVAARTNMSLASLYGGLALANAGLGAVHGFAGPLGGMFPAPHGAVCAALLPHVLEVNFRALQQRNAASPALQRFAEVARILTHNPGATAQDGIAWVKKLCGELGVPRLRSYGVKPDDLPSICQKGAVASSMKGNPVALTAAELKEILEQAL